MSDRHALSILNSARYAIIATDMNGLITFFNPAAHRLLGYESQEIIQVYNFSIFLDPFEVFERAQILCEELKKNVEIGFPVIVEKTTLFGGEESEWTFVDQRRNRLSMSLSVSPMLDAQNKQEGYLFIARDISNQKELEKRLEENRASLVSSSKLASLGEMAGGIAHEINNPLAIIMGKVDRLLMLLDNNKYDFDIFKKDMNKVKDTVTRISKIITGLRSYARSGEKDPFEKTSCEKIIQDTLGLCAEKLKFSSIPVEIIMPHDFEIECRPIQISQVLLNLVTNSADAIQKLEDRWIKIIVSDLDHRIQIQIVDSGAGIPDNVAKRLMEPFFTTKEIGKGTGLGLSVSLGILKAHEGTLILDRECENTKFVIEIPKVHIYKKVETTRLAS